MDLSPPAKMRYFVQKLSPALRPGPLTFDLKDATSPALGTLHLEQEKIKVPQKFCNYSYIMFLLSLILLVGDP